MIDLIGDGITGAWLAVANRVRWLAVGCWLSLAQVPPSDRARPRTPDRGAGRRDCLPESQMHLVPLAGKRVVRSPRRGAVGTQ